MELEQLLKSIQERNFDLGIATAASYLNSIAPCFEGGSLCPTAVFEKATVADWTKALADGSSKLVYHDPDMTLDGKAAGELTKGSILDFDCVLTSRRKDRDGDILETKGATLDEKMPLLFNHVPMMPIGTLVKLLGRDDDRIRCKFAIADTELGRDMAALVELSALRLSHGFKAVKGEPLAKKDQSTDGRPNGWHIKEFDVMEGSLVSIPSNVDGVITAYSRSKLTTPLVKSWAKKYFDARPAQGVGLELKSGGCGCSTKAGTPNGEEPGKTVTKAAEPEGVKAGAVLSAANKGKIKQACDLLNDVMASCKDKTESSDDAGKSATVALLAKSAKLASKGYYGGSPYGLEGSFEAITGSLLSKAPHYLKAKDVVVGRDHYVTMVATFADRAIVCVWSYDSGRKCYQMSWEMNDDKAQWTGDPKEVEIVEQVIEKAIASAGLAIKSAGTTGTNGLVPPAALQPEGVDVLARKLAAQAFLADGDAGVKALELAQKSIGVTLGTLKTQQEEAALERELLELV